jgi:glycosyltransferase involved in cell wall biosynthesis
MDTLRVAHIITQLELGGAQRNTLYTVTHLHHDRFAPLLITGENGILDDEARHSGVPVVFVRSLVRTIRPWKDVQALIALYRILRHLRPHIVHTHSSKAGILGRLAAYLAGVPVIVHTFHGFGFTPDQNPILRRALIQVEKWSARLSTHLIFVSAENRQQARQLGIGLAERSSLIRSGIIFQTPASSSSVRQELRIPETAWVVTSVGNFKPQKNPMDLAKIGLTVLVKDPEVHFLLVGDGSLRSAVEAYVREHKQADHVYFLGWRHDIPDILAASDTFLLTSRWEGLPRALVEAFWSRLPAVAYAVDGIRELLEDGINGFSIPPGEVALAAERILWLKAHTSQAKQMGAHGRARVREEFDIDLMVRQQEELYEHLYGQVPLREYHAGAAVEPPPH